MEMHRVTFEMINGEKFTYDFKNTDIDELFRDIINAPYGFLEVNDNDETHYLAIDKIVRFKIVSESTIKKRKKENEELVSEVLRRMK